MATFDGLNDDINLDINVSVDVSELVDQIMSSPDVINQLAQAVSVILTKQARGKGNLFGTWAQKQPAPVVNPPQAIKRLN